MPNNDLSEQVKHFLLFFFFFESSNFQFIFLQYKFFLLGAKQKKNYMNFLTL